MADDTFWTSHIFNGFSSNFFLHRSYNIAKTVEQVWIDD